MKIIRGLFGFVFLRVLNVRKGLNYDQMRDSSTSIYNMGKRVFSRKKSNHTGEKFEEAMARLNVSENDLRHRYAHCQKIFYIFSTISVLLLVYAVYLLWAHAFSGAMLAVCVAVLSGANAFKYNFWMFQIERRKLGCQLSEWRARSVHKDESL
jgi:intracellular multiplication protein IcmV